MLNQGLTWSTKYMYLLYMKIEFRLKFLNIGWFLISHE